MDKKVILTCIKNFFEYHDCYIVNPELPSQYYLRQIILFCREMRYPALEIFILGIIAPKQYPELKNITNWSDKDLSIANYNFFHWLVYGYKPTDSLTIRFFKQLDLKIKYDRTH